jgi:hypothetical protein
MLGGVDDRQGVGLPHAISGYFFLAQSVGARLS